MSVGVAAAALLATAAAYLTPHLVRAADPGCAAYKASALATYRTAITDLNDGRPAAVLSADGGRAAAELRTAAGESRNPIAAGSLSALASNLGTVLSDVRSGGTMPSSAITALNRASARADAACGTLRL